MNKRFNITTIQPLTLTLVVLFFNLSKHNRLRPSRECRECYPDKGHVDDVFFSMLNKYRQNLLLKTVSASRYNH